MSEKHSCPGRVCIQAWRRPLFPAVPEVVLFFFFFFLLSAPSMPRDVRAYSNSSTQLVVRWSPPVSPNGNQTYYWVKWQQQAEDKELYQHNYCSKGIPTQLFRRNTWLAVEFNPIRHSCSSFLPSELKIPIRIAATGDKEDDTKPTKPDPDGAEKGPCCPCPKSPEALEAEAADASYRKVFENFLHNSIFTQR